MVPKKHKSKRVTARIRYKNEKRARENRRKERKESRENMQSKRSKKDPGIPNLWPFKDSLLTEIEQKRIKAQEEKERQKNERLALMNSNRTLESLVADANKRSDEFEANQEEPSHFDSFVQGEMTDGAVSGTRDNSRKAYFKEFKKVVENSDVILEVLDARDPIGSRAIKIEQMILSSNTPKRIILILNKIDLVPKPVVQQWLAYLRNEYPTIAFKASTQKQRDHLGRSNSTVANTADRMLTSSECFGADELMKLLKNYCRNQNIKTAITIGVIGFPNVGKSSVINSLKRSKVCGVGSTPGLTKSAQTITLDKNIKLLDCPGIVFTQGGADSVDAVLRNCVKIELLDDPVAPVEAIVSRCKKEQLVMTYNIPLFTDHQDFLVHIARQRGRLKRGGVADINSAARLVLQDWNSGKIPYYTIPPTGREKAAQISAEIVQQWSAEFQLDDIKSSEQTALASTSTMDEGDSGFVLMDTLNAGEVDMDMTLNGPPPESSDDDNGDGEVMEEDESFEEEDHDDNTPEVITAGSEKYQTPPSQRRNPAAISSAKPLLQKKPSMFTEEEIELNPQHGKSLRKQMKQKQKNKRRSTSIDAVDMEMDDGADDSYDFTQHFGTDSLPTF